MLFDPTGDNGLTEPEEDDCEQDGDPQRRGGDRVEGGVSAGDEGDDVEENAKHHRKNEHKREEPGTFDVVAVVDRSPSAASTCVAIGLRDSRRDRRDASSRVLQGSTVGDVSGDERLRAYDLDAWRHDS